MVIGTIWDMRDGVLALLAPLIQVCGHSVGDVLPVKIILILCSYGLRGNIVAFTTKAEIRAILHDN